MTSNDMITKSDVLNREGWTTRLVSKLLGEPDMRKSMPYYTHPLCLYSIVRVKEAELTDTFKDAQVKLVKRRAAAAKAIETKRKKLMAEIESLEISVVKMSLNAARKKAIKSYNDWNYLGGASMNSDQEFLDRITVNYLRHECTEYDEALFDTYGNVGKNEAIKRIRQRVFDVIAKAYPELAIECLNQQSR